VRPLNGICCVDNFRVLCRDSGRSPYDKYRALADFAFRKDLTDICWGTVLRDVVSPDREPWRRELAAGFFDLARTGQRPVLPSIRRPRPLVFDRRRTVAVRATARLRGRCRV